MKIKLIFVPVLFISLIGFGQQKKYFEGTIIYKHTYKTKSPDINPALLEQILGDGSTLSFKQGNYCHDYKGGRIEFDLYLRAENKYYFKKRGNDTIFWNDCRAGGEKIISLKSVAGKENILGILCDQLIMRYKDHMEVQYYNADSLSIDPDWFSDYKKDDENLIDEKEKSIFLKSETDFSRFVIINTAVRVTRLPLNNRIFKLQTNAIFAKSVE